MLPPYCQRLLASLWLLLLSAGLTAHAQTHPDSTINCSASGSILREQWDGNYDLATLPLYAAPTSSAQLPLFEGPTNYGEYYGDRIRGYVCPPLTGNYTFWIAGDDQCELWLSSDDTPTHKVRVASVPSWTYSREWTKYPEQQSVAIRLEAGHRYYIEALHHETFSSDNLAVAWQLPTGVMEAPIPGNRLSPFVPPPVSPVTVGTLLREQWNNLDGSGEIQSIPLNSPPVSTAQLAIFESPRDIGDYYGARIRGYVHPPQTGTYTFWVASDDAAELWLSTDENPANKLQIASVSNWTSSREWYKYGQQRSVPIRLEAGRKYYVEALHKEVWGGDNLAVQWQLPDGTLEGPILGNRLSTYLVSNTKPEAGEGNDQLHVASSFSPAAGRGYVLTSKARVRAYEVDGDGVVRTGVYQHADGTHFELAQQQVHVTLVQAAHTVALLP